MENKRITIQLKGDPSEDEHLRLHDFISQLDAIRSALSHLENRMSEPNTPSIQYRVVDLRHQSPATIVLEAIPPTKGRDVSSLVVGTFVNGVKSIKRGRVPENFDYDMLQAFKRIGAPFDRRTHRHRFEVSITADSETVEVDRTLEPEIEKIVGPDEVMLGSVSGTLEVINIHAGANMFRIYPVIGPKKVECHFKQEHLQKAIGGLTHYVTVRGELRYKRKEKFPYAINASDIDLHPEDDQLPCLIDLKGISPHATGNLPSEEFVRKVRDASW